MGPGDAGVEIDFEIYSGLGQVSALAFGILEPYLYADSITEEQKRLGYARVLVEIDMESECPKEIVICRANGDSVNIGVEYPWLPPKCSLCGGFGHAVYACSKKETKKWVPKTHIPTAVQ
jgi:hypothetical protein